MQTIRRYCRAARKSTQGRRLVAALAAVAYALSIVGLPLWQPAAATNERFACQHRRCGCASAEQCWTSCCCFTLPERIAWARANNVKIPARALASAALATGESPVANAKVASAKAGGRCCAKKSHESSRAGRIVWVNSVQAQKCRGVAHGWMTLGMPVFWPPPVVAMDMKLSLQGQISFGDARELSRSDRPATRPG